MVEPNGGLGAVGKTVTVIEMLEDKVVVEPEVAEVDVLSVPRLHTAEFDVVVQVLELALAALICEFAPCTVAVKTAPTTGSPMLYTG